MRQTFILLITLFIILSCNSKNQEKDDKIIKTNKKIIFSYPNLFIENKIVDFGSVPKDTILKANYKLTNPSEVKKI